MMISDERALEAIHALIAELRESWVASDADRLAGVFSDDAWFVAFNGTRLHGREAIARFHVRPFAHELRGARLQVDIVDIRVLSAGIYLLATTGGPIMPGGDRAIEETQSHIVQDLGDRWAITLFHNTPVRPLPSA